MKPPKINESIQNPSMSNHEIGSPTHTTPLRRVGGRGVVEIKSEGTKRTPNAKNTHLSNPPNEVFKIHQLLMDTVIVIWVGDIVM